jgi:hypothetical protein
MVGFCFVRNKPATVAVLFFFFCPNVCLYVAAVLPTEREGKGFAWVKGQIIFEPVWVS